MPLSITPRLIISAAQKRGWQATVLNERFSFYRLDIPQHGSYYIRNITSTKSSSVNGIITGQKDLFHDLVSELGAPVPATLLYSGDMQAAYDFLAKYGCIVVKPTDQSHGKGITINLTTPRLLEEALEYAAGFGKKFLLQQQVEGDDYRLLFIGGKLAAAAIRKPAYVIGDGTHTISQLIGIENDSGKRGDGYHELLTTIDEAGAERYLNQKLQDVPLKGKEVRVIGMANIGRGGVSIDVTDTISPHLVEVAQKVIDHFRIGLGGVDLLVSKEGVPYLIEINTSPSLGLHEFPFSGKARQTPDKFLDWLIG